MRRLLAVVTPLLLTLGVPAASADPFRITAVLTFGEQSPPVFSLLGPELPNGVQLLDTQGVFSGLFQVPLLGCYPCQPGTVLSPNLDSTSSQLGSGTVSVEGGPRKPVYYDGSLSFAGGTLVAPSLGPAESASISRDITGLLLLEGWANPEHSSKIFGTNHPMEGTATATFARRGDEVFWTGMVYELQNQVPVPEPASFVLLSSGAAALIAWRRRRRP